MTKETAEYAHLLRRAAAWVVDGLLWFIASGIVGGLLNFITYGPGYFFQQEFSVTAPEILLNTAGFPALVIFFWYRWQATPGKMLFDLQICDAQSGGKPPLEQCVKRFLAYIPSLVFLLGFIWAIFDERKQGWHDILASTAVIRKGAASMSFGDAPPPPPTPTATPPPTPPTPKDSA